MTVDDLGEFAHTHRLWVRTLTDRALVVVVEPAPFDPLACASIIGRRDLSRLQAVTPSGSVFECKSIAEALAFLSGYGVRFAIADQVMRHYIQDYCAPTSNCSSPSRSQRL